jgi:hypothetical protein
MFIGLPNAFRSVTAITSFVNPYPANVENMVAPTNASKWRMVFNSAFKGLTRGSQTFRLTEYRPSLCAYHLLCMFAKRGFDGGK